MLLPLDESEAEEPGRPDVVRLRALVEKARELDRRPDRFEEFLLACQADAQGRTGMQDHAYPQAERLRAARAAAMKISARDLNHAGLGGEALGQALREARVEAIERALA